MAERPAKHPRGKKTVPPKSDNDGGEEEKKSTVVQKKCRKLPTYKKATISRPPSESLPQRTVELAGEFVHWATELGIEGLTTLFNNQLVTALPPLKAAPGFSANMAKNRYQDVICLEETRVRLEKEKPEDGDYIHANWIKFPDHDRTYIATQGPLENTIEDFWRMVWQEKTQIIVNLTKCVEDGKSKCAQYWPDKEGDFKTYGRFTVTLKKLEKEDKDRLTVYTLEVLPEGCSDMLFVRMLHTTHWSDGLTMQSSKAILRLIKSIFNVDKLAKSPVVIHCSAGIGRTGTLLLIDYLLYRLFNGKAVSLVDSFMHLRTQRASSVQKEGQFVYIVVAVVTYIGHRISQYDKQAKELETAFSKKHLNAG